MAEQMGDRLVGRVAIVTGSGEGIGRGIARRYAREGARVVVAEIRDEWGEKTAADIRDELGGEARFVHADVAVKADALHMVDEAVSAYGGVDILVNNAQAFTPMVPLEEKQDEWFEASITSGLMGSFWSMQAAFPHLRDSGRGRIINFADHNPREAAAGEKTIPLGRMGDPENDIGGVALFLASDDGQYLTGQTLFADGGGHLGSGWKPPRSTTADGLGHYIADT
jgi:NAD(P)-dependent dehydrogenase (short-subunit alcohol dehydrogenase family)